MVPEVFLVGVGMGNPGTLTAEAREAIARSEVLLGGSRMLEPFAGKGHRLLPLVRADGIVRALREEDAACASVLFSGDIGFYSGAQAVTAQLADIDGMQVRGIPGISSASYLCARLLVPWQDVRLVSAHGRACDPAAEVRAHGKVLFLTGGAMKAQDICRQLAEAGLGSVRVQVGERLSYPDERICAGTAAQLAGQTFCNLSVALVDATHAEAPRTLDGGAMTSSAPRLIVGSTGSGAGKTTFACALMQALMSRGMRVQAGKCGPDYIDPLFHREVIGTPSRNLDLFFMDANQTRRLMAEGAAGADITVIEGAMGYYDGIAMSDEASTWDVARTTESPAILVVDGRGRARSLAAEVQGFARFHRPSHVAGIVFNRISPALYPRAKALVEAECGIPAFGYLPELPECGLESRHLGLVLASEVENLRGKLQRLAQAVEQTVDIDALVDLARSAPDISFVPERQPELPANSGGQPAASGKPVIAVARDKAFCFYYEDTLRLFQRLGARIVEFSPLEDARLPKGAGGLYLGGGYPELHARELSQNAAMRAAVRAAVANGMPVIAECGGFMYLHEWLEDPEGALWPMAGAVPGTSRRAGKLARFGYISLTAKADGLLTDAGASLPAHEFHYWDSDDAGDAFHAQKPQSPRGWDCAFSSPTLYAGYPHLCLHARPDAAARFVRAAAAYAADCRRHPKGEA